MSAFCAHGIEGTGGYLAVALFTAGLAGGFTHCAGMCGPFVLAQAVSGPPVPGKLEKLKSSALVPYHLGRMTTYVVLAVLFSTLLSAIVLDSPVKKLLSSFLLLLAAFIFLSNAVPALGRIFPWMLRFPAVFPVAAILKRCGKIVESPSFRDRFFLGVLLGFMPCGLVLAALVAASAAKNPFESAVAMAAFAAGTVPALFLVSAGGRALKAVSPAFLPFLSAGISLLSGLSLMFIAGTMML